MKITPVICIIIGFILSAPFVVDCLILGHTYFTMPFYVILFILALMIGAPTCLFGIFSLLTRNSYNTGSNVSEIETSRIRYAIEEDLRRKK